MRKTKKHTSGLTFSLEENLIGKKKIFIHLSGNSQTMIPTIDGALNFADWLRDVANKVDEWADEVENG